MCTVCARVSVSVCVETIGSHQVSSLITLQLVPLRETLSLNLKLTHFLNRLIANNPFSNPTVFGLEMSQKFDDSNPGLHACVASSLAYWAMPSVSFLISKCLQKYCSSFFIAHEMILPETCSEGVTWYFLQHLGRRVSYQISYLGETLAFLTSLLHPVMSPAPNPPDWLSIIREKCLWCPFFDFQLLFEFDQINSRCFGAI